MKDYYSVLNIATDASATAVKKAYFRLVRQFPPDRYPKEFMRIREAYEVLIDDNTRRQYDVVDSMPDIVKRYFAEGQKAMEAGDFPGAIKLLEEVIRVYPHFAVVKGLLGQAYLENDNSGKAIRVFEELVAEERNNAGFVRLLAQAYALRGWHKKAVEQFKQALQLDEDNISLWLGLIDSYLQGDDFESAQEAVRKGIEVSNRKGWDNLELYFHIIQIDIFSRDYASMTKHLEEMKNKAVEKEEEKTNVAWFLAALSKLLHGMGMYSEAQATIDTAYALEPDDEEIIAIKDEIGSQVSVFSELEKLKGDPSIDELFAEMLDCELHLCDDKHCMDCKLEQFAYEMDVVAEMESFRGDILRLKKSYPELYELKQGFFDNVLNHKKEQYLLNTYGKRLKKYFKQFPERFEPEDEAEEYQFNPEPYRRPEPKVGRNDPCPCGSGKKYKKCCGK